MTAADRTATSAADAPERRRYPPWPPWYGPLALVAGVAMTTVAYAIVVGIARTAGAKTTGPAITDVSVLLQDGIFVAVAVAIAAMTARPRAADFGLRAAPLRRTALIAAAGFLAYWLISIAYAAALNPKEHQTVTQDLGANKGAGALIAGAVVVIVVAPICEELFFRGFFYRALRTRLGVAAAAVIDGLLFGAVHSAQASLTILPVLALLGFVFCLVYERTGTLYATIALHAVNNSIAYLQQAHHAAAASAPIGAAMLVATAVATVRTRTRPAT